MKSILRNGSAVLLLAALAWFGAGCGNRATPSAPPTPTPVTQATEVPPAPSPTPKAVRVLLVEPVSQVTRNDEYYFDNCSPSAPATRSFSVAARVSETVTIADQATLLTGSATAPIPPALKEELAAEVKAAYKATLDEAISKVSQTTLYINAHDRYNVVIIWEERLYASTVTFPMDGKTYTAEYKYLLEVPRPGTIKPGICTP